MRFFGIDGCFRYSIKGFSLWRAGGGTGVPYVYGFGFWCGKDEDLICIRDFGSMNTNELDQYLSSLSPNVFLALVSFLSRRRGYKEALAVL